ncbi:MAG: GatB/YqeY domain-containing protein [Chloroflexota bacterium]
MSLKDVLAADLKQAMREGDETKRSTLRLVISAVKYAEVEQGKPLDDEGVLRVIGKEMKKRRESITEFERGKRPDLVAKEKAELEVLLSYMPKQMSYEEIVAVAQSVIGEVGAKGPADMGRVMPKVMAAVRGRAEGREVNRVVQELLARM